MSAKFKLGAAVENLLADERIAKTESNGRTSYSAVGLVRVLAETEHPDQLWADLKQREPELDRWLEPGDRVDLDGVFRIAQSIPGRRAERLKNWLAETARRRVEESANPELALLRTCKLYENRGYSRRWIDQRLRGVSTRHELTGEWYRRGAKESDDFRALTNALVRGSFGMDVEHYRRYKGLSRTGQHLRDHMTDLELSLVALGETVAVALHRNRSSVGMQKLTADAEEAGEIVAQALHEVERRAGTTVTFPGNHLDSTAPMRSKAA